MKEGDIVHNAEYPNLKFVVSKVINDAQIEVKRLYPRGYNAIRRNEKRIVEINNWELE